MSSDATENRQARILLVDDDPDHLALCARWLEGSGYPVVTATSGSGPETTVAGLVVRQ